MKSAIATGLRNGQYIIQIDGRAKSHHRRLVDALREGLQLQDQYPGHDIKVRVMRPSRERKSGYTELGCSRCSKMLLLLVKGAA